MGFRNAFNGLPPSSITAELLADGAVTGTKLSADAIDGKTITGAHIRTAASGKRWELTSDPTNRLLGFSGEPGEAAPGYLTVDADEDYAKVQLETPKIATNPTAILSLLSSVRTGAAQLPTRADVLADEFGVWTDAGASLEFRDGALVVNVGLGIPGDGVGERIIELNTEQVQVWLDEVTGHKFTVGTIVDPPMIYADGAQTYIRSSATTTNWVRADAANVTVSGVARFAGDGTANAFVAPSINATTSSGTAVQINTSNHIVFRASSGLRHKVDVRPLRDVLAAGQNSSAPKAATLAATDQAPTMDPHPGRGRVLDLEPIIYRDRHEVEEHAAGNPDWSAEPREWIGWAADDFAAAGWEELITRDDETGEPDYLHYERVLPVVVIELQAEIAELRARLDALGG